MSLWLADFFYALNNKFIWIGPLAFFLSVFFPFIASDKKTRKTLLCLWVASLCIGGFLALATYSGLPKSGMESMFTILVFPIFGPRWGLIANTIISSLYLGLKKNKTTDEKGLFSLYLFSLVVCMVVIVPMKTIVEPQLGDNDTFWRIVHERNISILPLETYQKHVSKSIKNTKLFHILSISENKRNFSPELLHIFYKVGTDVSGCSNLSEELFDSYLRQENHIFYTAKGAPFRSYSRLYTILKNENLPDRILLKVLNDPIYKKDYSVYLSIARNPNAEILNQLLSLREFLHETIKDSKKVDKIFREANKSLARHSTDEEQLIALSKLEDEEINKELTRNISTPYSVLNNLLRHENSRVVHYAQYAIYKSPKTPLNALRNAYKKGDSRVNKAIAENPILPEDLVEALFKEDRNGLIRERLIVGLANREPPDIVKIKSFIKKMPKNHFYPPHFPPLVNREVGIESGAAGNFVYYLKNTTLTDDELSLLLNSLSVDLKVSLAKHPKTDYRVLKFLSVDNSNEVALAAQTTLDEIKIIVGHPVL